MERQKFEEDIKDAFKDAEQSQSENVWVNIELDLERAEGKKMKSRVLFYQILAAASVSFALIMAGVGYYALTNKEQSAITTSVASNDLTHDLTNDRRSAPETHDISGLNENEKSSDNIGNSHGNTVDSGTDGNDPNPNRKNGNSNFQAQLDEPLDKRVSIDNKNTMEKVLPHTGDPFDNGGNRQVQEIADPGKIEDKRLDFHNDTNNLANNSGTSGNDTESSDKVKLPTLNDPLRKIDPAFEKQESAQVDAVAAMFEKLRLLEEELQGKSEKKKDKKGKDERLWTALGFAAGGYNGHANVPTAPQTFALNNAVNNQTKASGVAYSMGLSMGAKITDRLIVQGGFNYMTNSSSYTSDQVVRSDDFQNFKPATIKDLRAAETSLYNNNTVIPAAPHTVNNNIEFVSVPVQAGYLIIDRKIGLQFNAGVSTDFFLQNTIDPQSADLEKTTQERGADSPYRSLNFSGLMSTELTYRLADRYRVSLNPGVRYPFNSIYKENTGIDSNPLTFDVGLRFRYIFH